MQLSNKLAVLVMIQSTTALVAFQAKLQTSAILAVCAQTQLK